MWCGDQGRSIEPASSRASSRVLTIIIIVSGRIKQWIRLLIIDGGHQPLPSLCSAPYGERDWDQIAVCGRSTT